jgi:hypothetical protein
MSTQKAPRRALVNVSRNTYLVYLCSAHAFKTWREQNPRKDAKHDFPGFNPALLRTATAAYKTARSMSTDEILQHLGLLTQHRLVSRRPSMEIRDDKPFHFTLTRKGEKLYERFQTVRLEGEAVLPLLLDKRNSKEWNALVTMAFLARPASDSKTDAQVSDETGLSTSSVQTGRRKASQGLTVFHRSGGRLVVGPAKFIANLSGGFTSRCLDPDQWMPEEDTDLDGVLDGTPGQPAKPAPKLKVVPDSGSVTADTIKGELKKLGLATGGKPPHNAPVSRPVQTPPPTVTTVTAVSQSPEIRLPVSKEHFDLITAFCTMKGTTVIKVLEARLDRLVEEAKRFDRKAKERRLAEIKASKKQRMDEMAKMEAEQKALEAELQRSI